MPELPEVEAYRALAEGVLDRRVRSVQVGDDRFVASVSPRQLRRALAGRRFTDARRIGKLLVLDADDGIRLGLRFGMTGRLLVDGVAGVDRLVYSSDRDERAWDRFGLRFDDGSTLVVRDPRLLGSVTLDPDEGTLGPDALALDGPSLHAALGASTAPLKARIMDQARIAGIGNLLADEILCAAALAPTRPAGSLTAPERRRLLRHIGRTVELCMARGGSHSGDLYPERHPGGHCPRCGAELRRDRVGGRTTWWCPSHQR